MTMKDLFNLKTLFPRNDDKDLLWYNYMSDQIILSVFTIFFCIIGLVGNGNIIWLLGFRIKRRPFAIYILNLAVADFGSLVLLLPLDICFNPPSFYYYFEIPNILGWLLMTLLISMYSSCQLLLTAISIDRWVSVCFPHWYRCHQSPMWFTTVCAFIWALSFALIGVPVFLSLMDLITFYYKSELFWGGLILTNLVCLLLVIISTLTLFFKVCLKSPKCQCGNLLKVTLLILLSFLFFSVLGYASFSIFPEVLPAYTFFWISLKGSINPLIYFLAGRESGGKFQERMKVILQRVFKEEKDTRMELHPRTQRMPSLEHQACSL